MRWTHGCGPNVSARVTTMALRVLSSRPNGPLMARTPPAVIAVEVFWLVEPRGFEPLTSCLQSRRSAN